MSDPGTVLGGRFVIEKELGRGGMGVVHLARDTAAGRVIALKTLLLSSATPEEVRRFKREAESGARLRHPNIVTIHETGVIEGRGYIVMEAVDGSSLDRLLPPKAAPGAAIALRDGVALLRDVARAVHDANERGVIHRDLKPQNVMVTPEGRPVVLDFGIARLVDARTLLTSVGATVGTAAYMPPEQAGAAGEADARSDVYSLGATLYHVVAGRAPFQGASDLNVLTAVLTRAPEPPSSQEGADPDARGDLDAVILRCLEKEPGDRYPSAEALAQDLDRWLAGEPVSAAPPSGASRAGRTLRRQQRPIAIVAAALSVALAAAVIVIRAASLAASEEEARRRVAEAFATVESGAARALVARGASAAGLAALEESLARVVSSLAISPASVPETAARREVEAGLERLAPLRADLLRALARRRKALGDVERARRHLDELAALADRDGATTLVERGWLRAVAGDAAGAEADAVAALAAGAPPARVSLVRARSALARDPALARDAATEALSSGALDAGTKGSAHVVRAAAHALLGDEAGAGKDLEAALVDEVVAADPELARLVARLFLERGHVASAAAALARGVRLVPDDVRSTILLGRARAVLGELDVAARLLDDLGPRAEELARVGACPLDDALDAWAELAFVERARSPATPSRAAERLARLAPSDPRAVLAGRDDEPAAVRARRLERAAHASAPSRWRALVLVELAELTVRDPETAAEPATLARARSLLSEAIAVDSTCAPAFAARARLRAASTSTSDVAAELEADRRAASELRARDPLGPARAHAEGEADLRVGLGLGQGPKLRARAEGSLAYACALDPTFAEPRALLATLRLRSKEWTRSEVAQVIARTSRLDDADPRAAIALAPALAALDPGALLARTAAAAGEGCPRDVVLARARVVVAPRSQVHEQAVIEQALAEVDRVLVAAPRDVDALELRTALLVRARDPRWADARARLDARRAEVQRALDLSAKADGRKKTALDDDERSAARTEVLNLSDEALALAPDVADVVLRAAAVTKRWHARPARVLEDQARVLLCRPASGSAEPSRILRGVLDESLGIDEDRPDLEARAARGGKDADLARAVLVLADTAGFLATEGNEGARAKLRCRPAATTLADADALLARAPWCATLRAARALVLGRLGGLAAERDRDLERLLLLAPDGPSAPDLWLAAAIRAVTDDAPGAASCALEALERMQRSGEHQWVLHSFLGETPPFARVARLEAWKPVHAKLAGGR